MLWVLKITVSMRRFFWAAKIYVTTDGWEIIYNFTLKNVVYLNLCDTRGVGVLELKSLFFSADIQTEWDSKISVALIRIYYECEGGIEKTASRITVWYHNDCRGMANGVRKGRGFLYATHANDGFIFLLNIKSRIFNLKVSKGAKIRNRYNQVPHLTQDTNGKVTNSQLYTTNESQEVSPFPAGDHKAQINRRAQRHNKHKTEKSNPRSYTLCCWWCHDSQVYKTMMSLSYHMREFQ